MLKRTISVLGTLFAIGAVSNAPAGAETGFGLGTTGNRTFTISDKVGKNQISFVSTAPLEKIHGTASAVSGSVTFRPETPYSLRGRIEVEVKSMRTGISKRDGHLMSDDWLDSEQYPTIAFDIHSLKDVTKVSEDQGRSSIKATAIGDFVLHGVTRQLSLPVEATYILESAETRKRAPGDFLMIRAKFQITLKDFEVKGARGLVGKRVGETIDVEAKFFAAASGDSDGE